MKDIKDMNLTECIDALRDQTKGDVWGMGHRDIIELTDRIEELTRWIPVSERFPYEADAKGAEAIVWSNDGKYWKRITPPERV
jgi:hypothetical protein